MKKEKLGLYIHIPFCTSKCHYCDFVSSVETIDTQKQYLQALIKEMEQKRKYFLDCSFDSVYIGGGTPSAVYDGFIQELTRAIHANFDIENDFEFTIEANPSNITMEKLYEYKQCGINRISLGVQCLDSDILQYVGRFQTIENVKNCFKMLKKALFSNVAADIMIGLPHQNLKAAYATLKFLIAQKVKHISMYSLQVEQNTLLQKRIAEGRIIPVSDEKVAKIYNALSRALENDGYYRYEISNFARKSFESRHNQKYWDGTEYVGVGLSASSFFGEHRYTNIDNLQEYIEKLEQGKSPVASKEYLNKNKKRIEMLMLSLRTAKGLNLEEFFEEFDENLLKSKKDVIEKLLTEKAVSIEDKYLKIEDAYMYVANQIILQLI